MLVGVLSECSIRVFHYKVTELLESIYLRSFVLSRVKHVGTMHLSALLPFPLTALLGISRN